MPSGPSTKHDRAGARHPLAVLKGLGTGLPSARNKRLFVLDGPVPSVSLPARLPSPPSPPCPLGITPPSPGLPQPPRPDPAQRLTLPPPGTHAGVAAQLCTLCQTRQATAHAHPTLAPEHAWTRAPAPLSGSLDPGGLTPPRGALLLRPLAWAPPHRNSQNRPFQAEGAPRGALLSSTAALTAPSHLRTHLSRAPAAAAPGGPLQRAQHAWASPAAVDPGLASSAAEGRGKVGRL